MKFTVNFKDPDFYGKLADAGFSPEVADKMYFTAEFGEYWTIEIDVDSTTGDIVGGKFIKAH
jgi:hypothetical protein